MGKKKRMGALGLLMLAGLAGCAETGEKPGEEQQEILKEQENEGEREKSGEGGNQENSGNEGNGETPGNGEGLRSEENLESEANQGNTGSGVNTENQAESHNPNRSGIDSTEGNGNPHGAKEQKGEILDSVRQAKPEEFLCWDTDKRVVEDSALRRTYSDSLNGISEGDLYNYTSENRPWGLILLINEIYARHGYIFEWESLDNYFSQKSWYQPLIPKTEFKSSMLNQNEQENIQKFTQLRDERLSKGTEVEDNTYIITSAIPYEPILNHYRFTFQVPADWLAKGYTITDDDTRACLKNKNCTKRMFF